MKIPSAVPELFCEDGQTDIAKLRFSFSKIFLLRMGRKTIEDEGL